MPVDVQDTGSLTAAFADIRRQFGPVAGIVHGAGVLADKRIEDLPDDQFQYVYSTKVVGLRNLLSAAEDDPLKAIVLFSSSTGRFGRTGQIAYAAANEVLNKTAQKLNRLRPRCRTVAINWGPWDGGMVTPALAKVFAKEGVGLIPQADGGEVLRRELAASDRPAEVVVIAKPIRGDVGNTPITPTIASGEEMTCVFERTVGMNDHPILRSHVIGEKAVVPMVMHIEWMAHAAMHGNPGLRFHGFDDLRLFQGVLLDERNPAGIRVFTGKPRKIGETFSIPVAIRGVKNGREMTHSKADIVLREQLPEGDFAPALPEVGPYPHSHEDVYDYYLFHGPDLRALERVDGISDIGIVGMARTNAVPTEWMETPIRGAWLADPMAIDAAFQLFILWSYNKHRIGSLPCFVGTYRQYKRTFPSEGVLVSLRVTRDNKTTARAEVDFIGSDGRLVARMTEVEHVLDPGLNEAFRKGRLTQPTGHSSYGSGFGG